MGLRGQKSKPCFRLTVRWAVCGVALGLAALTGCTKQGGTNIASPLVNPKPTGTPPHPFLFQWGTYGSGNGNFDGPSAVVVNAAGTTVYVADQNNNRIEAFSPKGVYLAQWAATLPAGLAVDSSGHVYVTTQEYVQEFDSLGTLLATGGGPGTQLGQFSAPQGLAVDAAGMTVYVGDSANQRAQAVTFIPAKTAPSYGLNEAASWGQGNAGVTFNTPDGMALAPNLSALYLADQGNSRVWALNLAGGSTLNWGGLGPNPGQFNQPQGLAVDPASGDLYVADTGNFRVEQFGPQGTFQYQWGGAGSGGGFFQSPVAVAVDGSGNIYVVDRGNNLVQKFGP